MLGKTHRTNSSRVAILAVIAIIVIILLPEAPMGRAFSAAGTFAHRVTEILTDDLIMKIAPAILVSILSAPWWFVGKPRISFAGGYSESAEAGVLFSLEIPESLAGIGHLKVVIGRRKQVIALKLRPLALDPTTGMLTMEVWCKARIGELRIEPAANDIRVSGAVDIRISQRVIRTISLDRILFIHDR